MNNLKILRNELGYSLQVLGDMCGRSKAQMHELEKETANPTLKTAYAISVVLDKPVTEIWTNELKAIIEIVEIRRVK